MYVTFQWASPYVVAVQKNVVVSSSLVSIFPDKCTKVFPRCTKELFLRFVLSTFHFDSFSDLQKQTPDDDEAEGEEEEPEKEGELDEAAAPKSPGLPKLGDGKREEPEEITEGPQPKTLLDVVSTQDHVGPSSGRGGDSSPRADTPMRYGRYKDNKSDGSSHNREQNVTCFVVQQLPQPSTEESDAGKVKSSSQSGKVHDDDEVFWKLLQRRFFIFIYRDRYLAWSMR